MENTQLVKSESPYRGLLYNVFQQPREHSDKGLVIAFTSPGPGEGVSKVTHNITNQLGQHSESVLHVDLSELQQESLSAPEVLAHVQSARSANIFELQESDRIGTGSVRRSTWQANWRYRKDCIAEWRNKFEYVLIDCPSLGTSGDALSVARLVDGIILVVEANHTRKQQIQHAERQIELAGGKLYGHVLNKRKYLIPNWIYRHL